jgi:phosphatidylserine decarboxylase
VLELPLQNKRAVVIIDSPQFGPVAVICIGATMVGSIVFTAEEGKGYTKVRRMGAAGCRSCPWFRSRHCCVLPVSTAHRQS